MKKLLILGAAAAAFSSAAAPAFAHHSFAMFNSEEQVVIEGTIVRWQFNNPHSFMIIEDADGQVWAFEGSAPAALVAQTPSMTGNTFAAGDALVVVQCPLRDGRPGGAAGLFITSDGTVYTPGDGGCRTPNDYVEEWPVWIEAGYRSLEEVVAAGELDAAE